MVRWRWPKRKEGDASSVPPPPAGEAPPPDEGLPEDLLINDPEAAKEAVVQSEVAKEEVAELSLEIHDLVRYLRAAREENNFAAGIVALIKEGR